MKTKDIGMTGVLRFEPGLLVSQISNPENYRECYGEYGISKAAKNIIEYWDLAQIAITVDEIVVSILTFGYVENDEGEPSVRVTNEPSGDVGGVNSWSAVTDTEPSDDPVFVACKIIHEVNREVFKKSLKFYSVYLVTKTVPTEVVGWSEWSI